MRDFAMAEHDFVIAGAGPAGAAFALFLRERGIAAARIALVDARTREAAAADDRMIAISQGSATLLRRLGAWRDATDPRATAIHTIHVSHRGHFGRTVIDRDDYGVPALGYVIRHGDLTRTLDRALKDGGLDVRRPLRAAQVEPFDDGASLRVTLSDGSALACRYAIHAEGGLFDDQERRAIHRDYAQSALTTFVTLAAAPSDAMASTAFERFTEDGPIALLPAAGSSQDGRERRGYAVVWCGKPDESAARAALDDDAFALALHVAFGDRLGRFVSGGPRRTFPLGLNAVDVPARLRSPHTAEFAIGNAAQTLHPVAGQGLNLGLRDAHDLAALLAAVGPDADAAALVARFIASRRIDRATTLRLTDFMPRVFANPLAPVAAGRGLTLALLDLARPLRGVFARQMMNGRR
jgi:2-octaprenyl-6-methoxyphenol hydroxylase